MFYHAVSVRMLNCSRVENLQLEFPSFPLIGFFLILIYVAGLLGCLVPRSDIRLIIPYAACRSIRDRDQTSTRVASTAPYEPKSGKRPATFFLKLVSNTDFHFQIGLLAETVCD